MKTKILNTQFKSVSFYKKGQPLARFCLTWLPGCQISNKQNQSLLFLSILSISLINSLKYQTYNTRSRGPLISIEFDFWDYWNKPWKVPWIHLRRIDLTKCQIRFQNLNTLKPTRSFWWQNVVSRKRRPTFIEKRFLPLCNPANLNFGQFKLCKQDYQKS